MAKRKIKTKSSVPSYDRNVNLEKISNGYLVSTYTNKGKKAVYAKNLTSAKEQAAKLL